MIRNIPPLFLLLLGLPVPILGVPLSNILFFLLLLRLLSKSALSQIAPRYIALLSATFLILLLLFIRSTPLAGHEGFLAFARYLIAMSPLFCLTPLTCLFLEIRRNKLIRLLKTILVFFPLLTISSFATGCGTTYGGPCLLFQESSSFGAAGSALIISLLILLVGSKDPFLRYISIFDIMFFIVIGFLQGARTFWVLLFLQLFVHATIAMKRSICRLRVSKSFVVASVAMITSIAIYLNVTDGLDFTSINRLNEFLADPQADVRLSDGFLFNSKLDLVTTDLLFGKSLFSQLSAWNATSAYDSSINFLLSDFGVVGSTLLGAILLNVSMTYCKYLKRNNLSCIPFLLGLILYLLGSLVNEFIVLKAFNAIWVYLMALFSAYFCQPSSSRNSFNASK
jgi:hypothetical protein